MEKNIVINEENVQIKFIDNNVKDTLVCIHGLYSNKDFIGELQNQVKSFNILSFSYGEFKKMEYENIKQVISKIIFHHLRRTKIHILAHSMGAIFASDIGNSKKIKSITFINPIHPYILNYRWFRVLAKYVDTTEKVGIREKIIDMATPKLKKVLPENFYKFLNKKSNWYSLLQKTVTNENVIKNILKKNFINVKNKSTYMISNEDKIISKEDLVDFLKTIDKKYIAIKSENHSPLLDDSSIQIAKVLNKNKIQKRFFLFKNIFKW